MHMADALAARGYVVHTSRGAEAALALTSQVAFNLVVVGAGEFAAAAPVVRALLRNDGIRQAVVFFDPKLGGDPALLPSGTVAEIGALDDPIARLRMLVPSAGSSNARRQES